MGTGYTFLYQSYRFRVVLVAVLSLLCIGSWPNMERLFLFEWVNDKTLFRLGPFSRMECKNWHGLAQKGKHLRTEQWKTFPNSNKIFQICQVNKLRVVGLLCSGVVERTKKASASENYPPAKGGVANLSSVTRCLSLQWRPLRALTHLTDSHIPKEIKRPLVVYQVITNVSP